MKALWTRAAIGFGLVVMLPAFAALVFGSALFTKLSTEISTEEEMRLVEQCELQGDAENSLF